MVLRHVFRQGISDADQPCVSLSQGFAGADLESNARRRTIGHVHTRGEFDHAVLNGGGDAHWAKDATLRARCQGRGHPSLRSRVGVFDIEKLRIIADVAPDDSERNPTAGD